jgi:hypothetical protein
MGTKQGLRRLGQRLVAFFAIAWLTFGLFSCAKPIEPTPLISEPTPQPNRLAGQLAEVSPPEDLETLKQIIDAYTPQVRILSPRPGEVLKDTAVTVKLQVRGLPVFKNEDWQLGPHLHVFLDDEPYRAVYDLSEPLVFEDLSPGTHTLRVFASRPWHESFKNHGAFDQRTFHVYAQTPQNELNASAPLLTYSRPQGTYGAEPIMLDFYLTNAPLHLISQADGRDDLHDWRIRCTVNDQSFVFDQWQPIWLKGFKPGRNWVQLELIDEAGNPIDNRFNNTVRVIDYEPGGSDTLARLVRGELDIKQVAGIIDPTYVPPVEETPGVTPSLDATEPEPQPEPEVETPVAPLEPTLPEPELPEPEPSPKAVQPEIPEVPRDDTAPLEPPTTPLPAEDDQSELDTPQPETSQEAPSPSEREAGELETGELEEEALPEELLPDPDQLVMPEEAEPETDVDGEAPPLPGDSAGDRGLLKRFKRWRKSPAAPAPQPANPPEDLFSAPAPTPETETPEPPAATTDQPQSPASPEGDLPSLDPELTAPSLTEPRLESPNPSQEDPFGEEVPAPTPDPEGAEPDTSQSPDQDADADRSPSASPTPLNPEPSFT